MRSIACAFLDLDLEGSEMDFFRNEAAFMGRVQTVILEWHKWRVSLDELKTWLGSQGFTLKQVLHEDEGLGTAIFSRS